MDHRSCRGAAYQSRKLRLAPAQKQDCSACLSRHISVEPNSRRNSVCRWAAQHEDLSERKGGSRYQLQADVAGSRPRLQRQRPFRLADRPQSPRHPSGARLGSCRGQRCASNPSVGSWQNNRRQNRSRRMGSQRQAAGDYRCGAAWSPHRRAGNRPPSTIAVSRAYRRSEPSKVRRISSSGISMPDSTTGPATGACHPISAHIVCALRQSRIAPANLNM